MANERTSDFGGSADAEPALRPGTDSGSTTANLLTRRELIGAGVAASVAVVVTGPPAPPAEAQGRGAPAAQAPPGAAEELWLVNGRIHTMDRNNTVAKTVGMRNGRFIAVDAAPPRPGPGIRIIDLRGRTVVPGIIDNHNHIVLMGNRPGYHTPLENAYSIRDVQEIVAARAKAVPKGAWITTIGGFHRNHLVPPGEMPRLPTLAELDAAAPNNPVYISEGFMGPSATNTLAKKFYESQNPPIPA